MLLDFAIYVVIGCFFAVFLTVTILRAIHLKKIGKGDHLFLELFLKGVGFWIFMPLIIAIVFMISRMGPVEAESMLGIGFFYLLFIGYFISTVVFHAIIYFFFAIKNKFIAAGLGTLSLLTGILAFIYIFKA